MDELDRKIKHIWNKAGKPDSRMKKGHCPEDTLLSSYMDGTLNKTDKERIEKHLLECANCLDLIHLYKKVREDEAREAVHDAPAAWIKKAMNLVSEKETVEGLFDIVLKFARETIEILANPGNLAISHIAVPVPVRGKKSALSANHITLNKTFSDVESEVEVTRVGEGCVNIRVMIKDIKTGVPAEGLRINLFNPHREIASYIAKNGEVRFEDIGFGKYVIKLNRQGKEIGQLSLNIKE
jgi:hypothetical protein